MKLSILGTRGIPAQHGGFETFAEKLALHLADKGWDISVYCQESGQGEFWESDWQGIRLIHIPVKSSGTLGTMIFDWKATKHATRQDGIFLTLGYNTAIFNILQRMSGQTNIINMDGIEWKREKWGIFARTWFWLNERIGCWIGNHLVADHPKIKDHLSSRVSSEKITMIPYGADLIDNADEGLLDEYGITAQMYSIIIARPEPENSILEMVRAFSKKKRHHKLVILGNFTPNTNDYHKKILTSASDEVIFPGAVYTKEKINSLRYFSKFYLHGHQVGGTNPSLVEALGAKCAVIAHDNHFNRWVAGPGAAYFEDESSCSHLFDELLSNKTKLIKMKDASYRRFSERFDWENILQDYESLLTNWYPLDNFQKSEQTSSNV